MQFVVGNPQDMVNGEALVSIGMPVYNGQEYIARALDSLLAQDYAHFELIISDNASTDETLGVCWEYANRDPRIVILESDINHGASWNFGHVLSNARGDYFMWAAHDDQWDANYISSCLGILASCPDVVTCCSRVQFVDAEGRPYARLFENLETRGLNLVDRIELLLSQDFWCAIYGLHRSDVLRAIWMENGVWGGDVVLTLRLLLRGDIARSNDTHFHYTTVEDKSIRAIYAAIDPNRDNWPQYAPYAEMIQTMVSSIKDSELSVLMKAMALHALIRTALVSNQFLRDIISEEYKRMFFSSYEALDHRRVLHSFIPCVLLDVGMLADRGVWARVVRSLRAAYGAA